MWVETNKPTSLDDMVLDASVKNLFQQYIKAKDTPNITLAGTPGIGKTTLAKLLPSLLGEDVNVLYINASSENGIDVIRDRIANFVEVESFSLKIVILDEADGLTTAAQNALRNIIETDKVDSRFIFTCNYPHKISDAIKSRCPIVNLHFSKKDLLPHVLNIIKKNTGVSPTKEQAEAVYNIVNKHFPDIRTVIGLTENLIYGGVESVINKKEEAFDKIFEKILSAKTFTEVYQLRDYWIKNDYIFNSDYSKFASALYDYIENSEISNKIELMLKIAEYIFKIDLVVDKELQFHAMILYICLGD